MPTRQTNGKGLRAATKKELAAARSAWCCTDDLEIDDNAKVSEGDYGLWVQAWVWLFKEEVDQP